MDGWGLIVGRRRRRVRRGWRGLESDLLGNIGWSVVGRSCTVVGALACDRGRRVEVGARSVYSGLGVFCRTSRKLSGELGRGDNVR